jgi:hypothetical protein
MKNIIIGIDCGLSGAIATIEDDIMSVVSMPVKKQIINKKNKNVYDIPIIISLFEGVRGQFDGHSGNNVICLIEKQGVRPGEGSVSAMTIGDNYGVLKGLALGFGFALHIIRPITWKKEYPELTNSIEVIKLREEIKKLNTKIKNIKDKVEKKIIKKEIDKQKRQVKIIEKDAARVLATKLYPNMVLEFERKKDDGKAEAVLMALYAKNKLSYEEVAKNTLMGKFS